LPRRNIWAMSSRGLLADVKAQAAYQGLLEVLEPVRRTIRQQRELSDVVRPPATGGEKRAGRERRGTESAARQPWSQVAGVERRKLERRTGRDRRTASDLFFSCDSVLRIAADPISKSARRAPQPHQASCLGASTAHWRRRWDALCDSRDPNRVTPIDTLWTP
jgi:hypothetical protein